MRKNYVADAISVTFILLFVYAAASKLIDFHDFRIQLGKSPLLTAFAWQVALLVPCMEIAISLFLASARWRLTGLYASFGLMVMFTAYVYYILHFASYIPCSCGGILQNMTWNQHIIFNLVFVALGAIAVLTYFPESRSARLAQGRSIPGVAENLSKE
ncbi:MAG TPA: MauE/DoxX family redox-associated membrane protein [Puia sp.]|jgi:hypothetical protein|nr:MauE/DoxX family redox-associated membrane protein [Puia sp.]